MHLAETLSAGATERRHARDDDSYFNGHYKQRPLTVAPGSWALSENPGEMLVSNVGPGICVAFFDVMTGAAALAHVQMPLPLEEMFPDFAKADEAMVTEALAPIDEAMHAMAMSGGHEFLGVRMVGGWLRPGDTRDCGTKNYVFVREYLSRRGVRVSYEDCSACCVWRVHLFPGTGHLVRFMLRRESDFKRMEK